MMSGAPKERFEHLKLVEGELHKRARVFLVPENLWILALVNNPRDC
jgi:hypothetical protein